MFITAESACPVVAYLQEKCSWKEHLPRTQEAANAVPLSSVSSLHSHTPEVQHVFLKSWTDTDPKPGTSSFCSTEQHVELWEHLQPEA